MPKFNIECQNTVLKVQDLLNQNPEWKTRYEEYAEKIIADSKLIREMKQKFREWKPLFLYMNVTSAKSNLIFSLRYLGQDVAKLKVGSDKITISTEGFGEKNLRDFKCEVNLNNCQWRSKETKSFRNHFSDNPKRTKDSGKGNDEHRIESLLLSEFSKKSSEDKILCNIQPVKLAGITRFQMPTSINASNINKLEYSGSHGGGIDILSRIGTGGGVKLCIMEVKDTNNTQETPAKAIQQGLAYATFIRELLRSNSGEAWWKLFGFNGKLPTQLKLYVACVMPSKNNNDISFTDQVVEVGKDNIRFHYLYYKESENKFAEMETSLNECKYKP